MVTPRYEISNEFNVTEMLERFDSNYIFDILNDKLENIDYTAILPDSNIVSSFEENFKLMNDNYPGDSDNIKIIRMQVYLDIINILCDKFNLHFNDIDDNVDLYTVAFYLYDFLVCNRNNLMVSFFTSFIINNKESLSRFLNLEDYRKSRDSSSVYGKRMYNDAQYGIISANMAQVLNHIATLDISLLNIFQSIYSHMELVEFLDSVISDKGNFFKDYYCSVLEQPEILPIIITNIRLSLQRLVGNIAETSIQEFMMLTEDYNKNE